MFQTEHPEALTQRCHCVAEEEMEEGVWTEIDGQGAVTQQ